ncbi:S8 family serine peptidase [Arthrobacter sp. yr096]|uniref:S8 family serine peptidase n=1 Tax=Arthrobacter sp. yr096 TaxID=1761750 RepID=UPI00210DDAF0|nr:S8 family serine peptidase [Arthrobacter sp. yr096]
MQTSAEPNDGLYQFQWNLREDQTGIRAPGAWEWNRGQGVVVAVVDTGITSHSELDGNVLPGYDMISSASIARDGDARDSNPSDEGDWVSANQCSYGSAQGESSWHGTHVAGTVAAIAGNKNGVSGVAPEARILPIRALGACGGYTSDIADSIIWAAGGDVAGVPVNPNPARVINLSLGGTRACSVTYQNAIDFAHNAGSSVVVSAGNSSRPAADSSPANCRNVIAVAASGQTGALAPYSNYGSVVDVTAPGGDMSWDALGGILSTSNTGATTPGQEAYQFKQGTSMAAPHVAGIAALLYSEAGADLSPDAVEQRLKDSARPLPSECWMGCGAGLVDAAAAVDGVVARTSVTPAPVVFADEDGTPNDTYTVPKTIGVEYVVAGEVVASGTYPGAGTVKVTARAMRKYVLAEGAATEWSYTFKATPFTVTPAAVVFTDKDGSKDDVYVVPSTTGVEYLVGGKVVAAGTYPGMGAVTVTAKATTDYVLAVGATASWSATFKASPFVVTPAAVTFTDKDGTKDDVYVVPSTAGVEYLVGGKVVAAGTYPGTGTVTVTAKAKTDYVLAVGATASWSATFKATPFVVTPAAVTFTDKDGTKDDVYVVPSTAGVEYLVGGKVVAAGTYPGTGTVTVTAKAKTDYVLAAGATASWSATFKSASAVSFADVAPGAQFHAEISWLASQGISTGWVEANGSRTFRPLQAVNRDAMAAFMYRLAGSPAFQAPAKSPFADVTPSTQFYKEITWLASQGISTGWVEANGSKTFRPVQPVNRDAMAAFMYRFAGKPAVTSSASFADVPAGAQFQNEISWLAGAGISTGWTEANGSKTYRPLQPVNRDAMAAFMFRYNQKYGK